MGEEELTFFRAGDLKRDRKSHARVCGYGFLNEELIILYLLASQYDLIFSNRILWHA